MAGPKKIKVAVIYGGRSNEHEISLQSAASVIQNLDRSRFEVVPIGIDKHGRWHLNDISLIEKKIGKELPMPENTPEVVLLPNPRGTTDALVPLAGGGGGQAIDVVFPVMHGPLCEDGSVQGLFELADMAYVGAGVLGSAIGMDKDVAKRLAAAAGLPVAPYVSITHAGWAASAQVRIAEALKKVRFPMFVKPANMGSSVGVKKVRSEEELGAAIENAFRYDTKVLVEQGVDAREIELAVLGNPDPAGAPLVSIPGEIIPKHEFYSYEAKYLDENGAELVLPAKLSAAQVAESQTLARELFLALECDGMARVDLFLDRGTGKFYFNEVNTLPGFTSISMYPKMWGASGIPYQELLSRLIDLALARHERKKNLVRDWREE